MDQSTPATPAKRAAPNLLVIRGQRVMLDADLAKVYGMTPRRLNAYVQRRADRFPSDFRFRLTLAEKAAVASRCAPLAALKSSRQLPYAYTEHGALMLAHVLPGRTAAEASVQVVRSFVRLRQIMASQAQSARQLQQLERKYDAQFKSVFNTLRKIGRPPEPKRGEIGFHVTPNPS